MISFILIGVFVFFVKVIFLLLFIHFSLISLISPFKEFIVSIRYLIIKTKTIIIIIVNKSIILYLLIKNIKNKLKSNLTISKS